MTAPHRTVCVIGGSGFVGRSLCAQLCSAGYALRVPTRNRQRARRLLVLPGLDLRQIDVHEPEGLRRIVSGSDAVINLVGILNERGHDGSGFERAHVELTAKIVAACRETGVGRLLQMSALKANAERGPSHYLRTKGRAEEVIKRQSGDAIDFTIFRPSVIFGPEDTFLNRFARLLRMSPILPLPQLAARFAPVHVEDVAAAFVRALGDSHTFGRTYELCGPDIYSLEEILAFLKRELGLRRRVIGLPLPLGRIQAWVADYLIPGKPFSLDNLRSMTVANVCNDNGFAALGIEPRPMAMTAREFLVPHRDHLSELRLRTGR